MTSTDAVFFIKETRTCQYTLVIHTPRLCGEPGFKSPRDDLEDTPIRCRKVRPCPDCIRPQHANHLVTDPTSGDLENRLSNRPLRLKRQIARSPRHPILGSVLNSSNLSPPHKGRQHPHPHHPHQPRQRLLPAAMRVTKTHRTRHRNSSSSPSRRSSTAKRGRTPTSRVSLAIWEC
jgi:hypothetical protein